MPMGMGKTSRSVTELELGLASPSYGGPGPTACQVELRVGALTRELSNRLVHQWHSRLAAHHQELVDLMRQTTRLLEDALAGLDGSSDQVRGELLELLTGNEYVDVQDIGALTVDGVELDVGLVVTRERNLCRLCSIANALDGDAIEAEIHAVLRVEVLEHKLHQAVVKVHAAEEGVSPRGDDLVDPSLDVDDRDVEGASAQVIDGDALVQSLAQAVDQRSRGRLVEDAKTSKPAMRPAVRTLARRFSLRRPER